MEMAPPLEDQAANYPLPKADLVDSRVGVYDYDEFDIMHSSDVDWTRIHVGKRCGQFVSMATFMSGSCDYCSHMNTFGEC